MMRTVSSAAAPPQRRPTRRRAGRTGCSSARRPGSSVAGNLSSPPRQYSEMTLELAAGFEHILYISCNPQTLLANVGALHASHEIVAAAAFDQFPYTHHLECGLLLKRR